MSGPASFPARFFDGRKAGARDVITDISAESVRIREPGGLVLAVWPAASVRLVRRHRAGQPLRLHTSSDDPARLTIDDPAAFDALSRHCRNLNRVAGNIRDNWKPVAAWTGAAVASIAFLLFVGVPYLAEIVARSIPVETEVEWGGEIADQMAGTITQRFGGGSTPHFCESEAGRAALGRLTARLTAGRDVGLPITVRVLRSPVVNAFALPGGQIIVLSGLIAKARDPAEVAGVLAHEIGHVAYRHPLELAVNQLGLATLLSFVIGDVSGSTIIVAGTQLILLSSYTRGAEREADGFAVEMLNRADISAEAMADFFDRLAEKRGQAEEAMSLINTHPLSRERAATIRGAATGTAAAMTDADWQALRAICDD